MLLPPPLVQKSRQAPKGSKPLSFHPRYTNPLLNGQGGLREKPTFRSSPFPVKHGPEGEMPWLLTIDNLLRAYRPAMASGGPAVHREVAQPCEDGAV
jgi:hypothetical protein